MRHAMILTLPVLALALTGCAGSTSFGVRADPLSPVVQQACPEPSTLLSRAGSVSDDAVSIARLGNALIDCDARRAVAVQGYTDLRSALTGAQ